MLMISTCVNTSRPIRYIKTTIPINIVRHQLVPTVLDSVLHENIIMYYNHFTDKINEYQHSSYNHSGIE